jgi:hypothetical protein
LSRSTLQRLSIPVVILLVTACAGAPVHYASLSEEVVTGKAGKVGVIMTAVPRPDTSFPGASCLLCLAAAATANSTLTGYTHTLSTAEVTAYRATVVKAMRADGADAIEITEVLDFKKLPDVKTPVPDAPKKDFKNLKATYGVDELVVIDVTSLGVERHYAAYISNADPNGYINGNIFIVDLASNAYRWQLSLHSTKQTEGKWDEPPSFPAVTNAYFEAIEHGKDQILAPLKR